MEKFLPAQADEVQRRRRAKKARRRRKIIFRIVLSVLVVALVLLFWWNETTDQPLFPTWDRILAAVGLRIDPASLAVREDQLRVDVLNVGNADAVLIRQGQKTLLIDAGAPKSAQDILDFLEQADVHRLDYVIASHFDSDHIGALAEVISRVSTDTFLYAAMQPEPSDIVSAALMAELAQQSISMQAVKSGQVYPLGRASIRILGPSRYHSNDNDGSVICRVEMDERSFLFMGDAELAAEQDAMIAPCNEYLDSDVLKVGHHGADTSTNIHFLNRVDPQYAVVSCGAGNIYGHPHEALLQRLSDKKITYYRTDQCGRIAFITDGETITVQTER